MPPIYTYGKFAEGKAKTCKKRVKMATVPGRQWENKRCNLSMARDFVFHIVFFWKIYWYSMVSSSFSHQSCGKNPESEGLQAGMRGSLGGHPM